MFGNETPNMFESHSPAYLQGSFPKTISQPNKNDCVCLSARGAVFIKAVVQTYKIQASFDLAKPTGRPKVKSLI